MKTKIFCSFALILGFLGVSFANSPLQFEEVRGSPFTRYSTAAHRNKEILEESPYRLNTAIIPEHYTLQIQPILDAGPSQWTSPGYVEITFLCNTTTNQIVFHRHPSLTVDEATVKIAGPNGAIVVVVSHDYNELYHFHTITLERNLVATERYEISMNFVAEINTGQEGLYRAEYVDDNNVTHLMATTQFESNGARAAFPCFDEPNLKATFDITIGRKKIYYKTVSNSGLRETTDHLTLPEWTWDIYNRTVKMPTYLVAFVISNYENEPAPSGIFSKPVKIYGPPHLISTGGGKYAANASAHIISYLESEYVHAYEMDKMDSIAIPANFFGGGAMENWGLNTYRESYLLFFEGEQGWSNKLQIASILSHELVHQWFGNLVTCNWWSQIWLNEGFATYGSFEAVQDLFGVFDYKREMLWETVQYALAYDVGVNQPVINSVNSPEEIDTIWSTISYDKGGSIIRMMEGFLGESTLKAGLIKYLQDNAYTGAEQDDLFSALDVQAHADNKLPADKTVKDIMDTWTLQSGYPLIRVSRVSSQRIYISQEIFGAVPGATDAFDTNLFWEVPIATATADSTFSDLTPKLWLTKNTLITSHVHDTTKWIFVNPDGMGYYRVLYDDELGALLQTQLQSNRSAISGLSRSQLVDDYFNFAKYKYISIEKALDMSAFLKNVIDPETDHVVWYSMFTSLSKALTMFQSQNFGARHSLRNYLLPILESVLDNLGWGQLEQDEGTRVLFRAKVLDWACALESDQCFELTTTYFELWRRPDATNPIPLDVQPVFYCAIAAQGGEQAFDFLKEKYESTTETALFNVQKPRLLNALACSKFTAGLDLLLEEVLDATTEIGKNTANIITVLQRVAMNSVGRPRVLTFIDNHFEELVGRLGSPSSLANAISTLSTYYSTEADKNVLASFIDKRKPELGNAFDRYLTTIDNNIVWVNDFYKGMDSWFTSNA